MRPRHLAIAIAATAALFSACGADDPAARGPGGATPTVAADPVAEPALVTISRSRFETRELRVAPGTTVVFENTDEFAHTVTSSDGSPLAFDSGELARGERFEVTFDEPGSYPYSCLIHPTMRAAVIVE